MGLLPGLGREGGGAGVHPRELARYEKEQEAIREKAVELERERDAKVNESDHLLHGHHGFANAVALFQVAIALGAIAALPRNRLVWAGSLVVGLGGLALLVRALLSVGRVQDHCPLAGTAGSCQAPAAGSPCVLTSQ